MSVGIPITVVGNLTSDPEMRSTSGGNVVNFTVAQNSRVYDRQAGQWADGPSVYVRCSAWRDLADHIAASLAKGVRVIAHGNLTQRSWTDKEGNNRSSYELQVDAIGPDLRYQTAKPVRAQRASGFNGAGYGGAAQQQPDAQDPSLGEDPWAPSAAEIGGGAEPEF